MRKPRATVNAWAAGIIDGEGCICIKVMKHKYYALHVIVGQSGETKPRMLSALKKHYGGNLSPQATTRNRIQKWAWQVICANAEHVLRCVLPYMVQKRDQALVALKHRVAIKRPGQRSAADHKRTSEWCYRKLRAMKGYHKSHPKWREKDAPRRRARRR